MRPGKPVLFNALFPCLRVGVERNAEEPYVFPLQRVVQLHHVGIGLAAVGAPAGPEIDEQVFAAKIRE